MKTCCYCNKNFDDVECRPYGIDGRPSCFVCAMLPDNRPETDRQFVLAFDRAEDISKGGTVIIGHQDGPAPGPIKFGENN